MDFFRDLADGLGVRQKTTERASTTSQSNRSTSSQRGVYRDPNGQMGYIRRIGRLTSQRDSGNSNTGISGTGRYGAVNLDSPRIPWDRAVPLSKIKEERKRPARSARSVSQRIRDLERENERLRQRLNQSSHEPTRATQSAPRDYRSEQRPSHEYYRPDRRYPSPTRFYRPSEDYDPPRYSSSSYRQPSRFEKQDPVSRYNSGGERDRF